MPAYAASVSALHGRLRGAAESAVRLKIVRNGADEAMDFSLVREPVRSPDASLDVRVAHGSLLVEAPGPWSVLDFEKGRSTALRAISGSEFYVEGGEHSRIAFTRNPAGEVIGAVLNPGRWQIVGEKID